MIFGYGDGGGGPTREMLENIREMKAFPATPRMRQTHVRDFFRRLEEESGDRLPTWNGELYFELHRGTYTTQSRNKRANRKSEFLLHDAEFLATLAARLDAAYQYPAAALHKAWETVCLNQFHDIIPGSSVGPVYDESQQQYAEIRRAGGEVRDAALAAIAGQVGGDLVVANPSSFGRADLAFWPGHLAAGQRLQRADGQPVAAQSTTDGTWLAPGEMAPFSVIPLVLVGTADTEAVILRPKAPQGESGFADKERDPSPLAQGDTTLAATPTLLENDAVRVELNAAGDITRVYDKITRREVLAPGALANQFQAFEDRPMDFDAWDVDIFYDDRMWTADPATSVQVVEAGPLRATLEVRRQLMHSRIVQRISLSATGPRLDFDTTVDWRERHILLKVAFPVDVFSPQATYEIQWGNVQRPTHRNTSWDWARFETCAQKWVDLSEGDYGVSLLNDCKYGHDVRDNVMRISLLRSPTMPDPLADQGEHRFVYSLLPHAGAWGTVTIAAAYALNDPLIVAERRGNNAASISNPQSLVSVDRPNVVVETIKQAEDGRGIIVRLYESQRQRGPLTLTTGFDLAEAWRTNLLEENQTALTPGKRSVAMHIKPYEIVTLRLVPA